MWVSRELTQYLGSHGVDFQANWRRRVRVVSRGMGQQDLPVTLLEVECKAEVCGESRLAGRSGTC